MYFKFEKFRQIFVKKLNLKKIVPQPLSKTPPSPSVYKQQSFYTINDKNLYNFPIEKRKRFFKSFYIVFEYCLESRDYFRYCCFSSPLAFSCKFFHFDAAYSSEILFFQILSLLFNLKFIQEVRK